MNPISNVPTWLEENVPAELIKSNPDAAIIVGTANRKENKTIVFRFIPSASPPMIVGADLETPGMMEMI